MNDNAKVSTKISTCDPLFETWLEKKDSTHKNPVNISVGIW